ncbi:MAG: hypothetical protein QXV17_12495 [Candidatus Micrarchaeaceae archaeon]
MRKWAGYKKYGIRWVWQRAYFQSMKRKYGEIQFYELKNLITEGYQRFWAYGTIK